MFSKALAIFALAAATLAAPASSGGLKVSVSAPQSLSSLDGLKVVASVTNTGSEDVTIINYGSVLDGSRPTQSFQVTKGGEPVAFTGIKLYLDMKSLDDSAYTTIKAGETVSVEHDVSALYDFAGAQAGEFTFTPIADLPVVVSKSAGGAPVLKHVVFNSVPSATSSLAGDLARREHPAVKRDTVRCSNQSQASMISSAYSEMHTLAGYARDYARSNGTSSIFKTNFKTNSPTTISNRFNTVATENSSSRTISCVASGGTCSGGVVAYTSIGGSNPISLCPSWFTFPMPTSKVCPQGPSTDQDSAAAVLLHEMTHATIGTTDLGYGCSFDAGLSASDALRNADSYNCFAMQVFLTTRC